MCYSAEIEADYMKYVRVYGADISIREFVRVYWERRDGAKIKIPKVMDAAFANPTSPEAEEIWQMDRADLQRRAGQQARTRAVQARRLADAERTLQTKTTKVATESKRIATDKIEWAKGKLDDLRRTQLTGEDRRIFPDWYAPVRSRTAGG